MTAAASATAATFVPGLPAGVTALLRAPSDPTWAATALDNFSATLADHAHCEKKAAVSAIALINAYPADRQLVMQLSALAMEELDHFREICNWMGTRGESLAHDPGDPYAAAMQKLIRAGLGGAAGHAAKKCDRLLVSALIEARSCERFLLLKEELAARGDSTGATKFARLATSEAGHAELFTRLARRGPDAALPSPVEVDTRLTELCAAESAIVGSLPVLARIH
jgi:tRNA-(ms[2]io[6]A)-hydroxylase